MPAGKIEMEFENDKLSQMPGQNLELWKSSGAPELWVQDHLKGWNHDDWLALLAKLRVSPYWPMNEAEIGQYLEKLRAEMLSDRYAPAPVYDESDGVPKTSKPKVGWFKEMVSEILAVASIGLSCYLFLCLYVHRPLGLVAVIWQAMQFWPESTVWRIVVGLAIVLAAGGFLESVKGMRWSRMLLLNCSIIAVTGLSLIIQRAAAFPMAEDSLDAARTAYFQHDVASFHTYVDVNAILSNGIDQLVENPALQTASHSDSFLGALLSAGVAVGAEAAKSYIPALSQSVEQTLVAGTLPSDSDSPLPAIASGLVKALAIPKWTYYGVAKTREISDTEVSMFVLVHNQSTGKRVYIKLKSVRDGDHWRVVAVQNLPDVLQRLPN
jgi:hypothetical protein